MATIVLAACQTTPTDIKPIPPSELLVPAPPMARLDETKRMPEQEHLDQDIEDAQAYLLLRFKYNQILEFGTTFYGWPVIKITPATPSVETSNEGYRPVVVDTP